MLSCNSLNEVWLEDIQEVCTKFGMKVEREI